MDKFEKIPTGIFDKVENNKQEFINKFIDDLEELFPETVKDGVVDFNALLNRFGEYEEESHEKYNMTWIGKSKAIKEADEDIYGRTLKYVEKDGRNEETTENLYIEGDNLEVLKLLRNSYHGKIKMIYIDPPYNTGNDFVYKDDFAMTKEEYDRLSGQVDEHDERLVKNSSDSGRYHSNWLNMMYPRLKVAKDLLTDDGVIFISIDDNEVHNMRKICDEIFREKNFIAELVWHNHGHTDNQEDITNVHEYILLYGKTNNQIINRIVDPNIPQDSKVRRNFAENSITKNGPKNPPTIVTLPKGFPCEVDEMIIDKDNEIEKFMREVDDNGYISRSMSKEYKYIYPIKLDKMIVKEGVLYEDVRVFSGWMNSDKLRAFIKNGFKPIEEQDGTKLRFYLTRNGVIYYIREGRQPIYVQTLLQEMGTTEKNRNELEKLGLYFDYPKPKELIQYLLSIYTKNNDVILDFFSGSSTTAHSVMQLNAEDGGNRKYIMIQLPESIGEKDTTSKEKYKNISEIGKERIRLAGDMILEANKEKEGIENLDIGFKVFRTEDTNLKMIKDTVKEGISMEGHKSISLKDQIDFNPHFTDIDVVYEMILRRQDIDLSEEIVLLDDIGNRTYLVGHTVLICLEDKVTEDIVRKIGNLDTDLSWIIMRDSAFEDNINLKINTVNLLRSIVKENHNGKEQKIYWI